jgi:protein-tyrosine phosphatase
LSAAGAQSILVPMVDIHCHLLPGLDDGPETVEESVQMAELALAEGITHIVATPHSNHEFSFDLQRNLRVCRELAERLQGRLQLATGCDFHLSYENLEAAGVSPQQFALNQKNYLLVEFADFALPPFLDEALQRLQRVGLRLIVTHPERNPLVRAKPERLLGWIESGCYVQITAQSLAGRFGAAAERTAFEYLDRNWVQFVATDAHSMRSRPPRLRKAYDQVASRYGAETAGALFRENPLAAWNGVPLPAVAEPEPVPAAAPRRRFFFF